MLLKWDKQCVGEVTEHCILNTWHFNDLIHDVYFTLCSFKYGIFYSNRRICRVRLHQIKNIENPLKAN